MKNIHFGIVLVGSFLACTLVAVALPQFNMGTEAVDPLTQISLVLANLPITLRENYKRIAAVVTSFTNGQLTYDQVLYFLFTGLYLAPSNSSDASNNVGGIGLPLATGCQLTISPYTTCYLCNEDCYTAHNLWGGDCGPSILNGQPTCLCAESAAEAARKGFTPDSRTTCVNHNPLAGEISLVAALFFRIRSITLQCQRRGDGTYDSIGCDVDCSRNHGFISGSCQDQIPNVPQPAGIYANGNDQPNKFCVCSHNPK